jgi:hypothetical protein
MLSLHDSLDNITTLFKKTDQRSRFLARQLLFLNSPLSKLVELYLYNNEGQPQKLDKFPMMRAIYDGIPRKLLLKCSRKTLKSTLISNIIALNLVRYNNYHMMYVSPDEASSKKFSHDYLKVRLESPPLKRIISKLSRDDVLMKEVDDSKSSIMLTYANEDPDRTRGPSMHSVTYDETQGMNLDILPVIAQTMAILPTKREIFAGTPLTSDNSLSMLWKRAHRLEWLTKCTGCNHWNGLVEENEPMKMIQKKGICCSKCGKILDTSLGKWIDFNPGKHEMMGFHLAQPLIPFYNQDKNQWDEIYLNCYNRDYSLLRIYNEVFGLSYDIGAKPITEEQLKKLCVLGEMRHIYPNRSYRYVYVVMGVDWGVNPLSSRTVCTLGGMREDGILEIFFIKIFKNTNYEMQIREMADIAKGYQPILITDSGPDPIRGTMLGNLYDPGKTQLAQYREGTITQWTDVPREALNWDQTRWCLNRSNTMGFTMDLLKKGQILFPRWEDSSEAMQDILAIFTEIKEDNLKSRIFYRHGEPDDFFHTLNYAACAAHLWAGNSFFTTHTMDAGE